MDDKFSLLRDFRFVCQPWQPQPFTGQAERPAPGEVDMKHLLRLGQDLREAGVAVAYCAAVGVKPPQSGKICGNREWLEDSLARIEADIALLKIHFGLDAARMQGAADMSKHLRAAAWYTRPDEYVA